MLLSVVPAFHEYRESTNEVDWKGFLSWKNLRFSLLSTFCQMMWVVMFINAVQKTTQINSYILTGIYPSIIVLLKLLLGT